MQQKFDVALVGSFADVHSSRVALLNELYAKLARPETIKVWAPTVGHLPVESPIRRHYMGPAWGYHMYEILNDSKMTLNHHGDVLPYANNMRLFESTGTGTLLITDWKENLHEMFESGKEVVTYRTPEECAEKIQHYLTHEAERQTIASAGQARTLRDHTYQRRCRSSWVSFADIFEKLAKNHAILQAYSIRSSPICRCGIPQVRGSIRPAFPTLRAQR